MAGGAGDENFLGRTLGLALTEEEEEEERKTNEFFIAGELKT